MELKDWLTVISTLLSPLIALQVSEFISRRRQNRDEQLRIFKTLMTTRGTTLDPRHVESLNLIDVVFQSKSKKEVEIRRLWKQYLDHLGDKNYSKESWDSRRRELFIELLNSMAILLGFDFDKTHIKTQTYYPSGFEDFENEKGIIRRSLIEILTGKRSLPMQVTNMPTQEKKD